MSLTLKVFSNSRRLFINGINIQSYLKIVQSHESRMIEVQSRLKMTRSFELYSSMIITMWTVNET